MFFNSTNPDAGGAPVAPSSAFAAADICIWKDGSATQKASAAGITVTSPFDSIVGLHLVEIDTSNNTDTGFWSSGSVYTVRIVTAKTVATYSVSGLLIGEFSLEVQTADVRKFGGTAGTFASGRPEVNITHIGGDAQSGIDLKDFVDAGYDPSTNRLTGAVELDSAATAALVDLIWDEPLTGATHNVATSSGKRLRQATAFQQIDSTVIDASASTTTFVTGLTSAVDDFYNDSMLVFTDGALAGQVRSIVDYVGATKTIILEEALTSAPVNGVAFTIVSLHIHPVSQIQSGLATASALAAAKTILDKVDTGLVVDGAVYQFTANMLELGPSGGGGSSVNVLPATGIVADRSAGVTLTPVVGETISQSITMYRTDGTTAVNVSGKTLAIVFETLSGVDVATVASGNITISGASSNIVTFAYPSAVTASERTLRFAIRDAAAPLTMYLQGVCSVVAAPKVDA
jgi:hypothetical protein